MRKLDIFQPVALLAFPTVAGIINLTGGDISRGTSQIAALAAILLSLFGVILSLIRPAFEFAIYIKSRHNKTHTESTSASGYICCGICFMLSVALLLVGAVV